MKQRRYHHTLLVQTATFLVLIAGLFWFVVPFQSVWADEQDDLQDTISDTQKKLKKEMAELAALQANLSQVNASLTSTQQLIQRTQALLDQTTQTIGQKEQEISNLEQQLALEKQVLSGLLQEMYYTGDVPLAEVILTKEDVAQLFQGNDSLLSTQEKMQQVIQDINDMHDKVAEEKSSLEETKADHETLLTMKNQQKQALVAQKNDVQADVTDQEATVSELQQKLAEMQSDLNVLTGNSYDASDIKDAVEYASDKTGVPKGVLYGFLKVETNLGANTGQCTYKEVEKVSIARYKKYGSKYKASIALLYSRQELFYSLVDDLGYGKSKKVSCSPSGYIGQGGAMGIPQFMSDVWNAYASQIAAKTGHKTPDPWNLTDGVMAMALKLKKAGATSDSAAVIRKASINYLGSYYANYYNGIVYWAKNYKKLFD
jgi:membrane-bound lytic murein transglycosylase B